MDIAQPWPLSKSNALTKTQVANPFRSFWMGGYECCDLLNYYGIRSDLQGATRHVERIDEDYQNLRPFAIRTVREGIVWSKVEYQPYHYNWRTVDVMMEAGLRHGIQQVWDICHFGMPDDLSPLHPHFCNRFTALCEAFTKRYHNCYPGMQLIITPINEVSFLSWLGGEVGATTPYCQKNGWQVKYQLCKAYISGINAIKAIDPGARILTTEPIVNIVPPKDADDTMTAAALSAHDEQFQVTDILYGTMCPELGGSAQHLDIVGYNYYFSNQFSCIPGDRISWTNEFCDERFVPLHELLTAGYERYFRPMVLSETSHPLEHRADWFHHITEECEKVIKRHIPLWGICWYPLLNRPDWDHTSFWHHSGLWEIDQQSGNRSLYSPLAEALFQEVHFNSRLNTPAPVLI